MDKQAMQKKLFKLQWPIYIIMVLAYLLTPFSRQALAVMMPELSKDLALDATQVGLIGLAYFWVYAVFNAPAGGLLDKIGVRLGVTINVALIGIGSFLFSIGTSLAFIIIGRCIIAVGCAGLMTAGVKAISSWFTSKQFPGLYGLWMALGALGGVLATTPLTAMMGSIGWRGSFTYIAIACIILAVLAYVFVRSNPADVGLDTPDEIAGKKLPPAADTTKPEPVKPKLWDGIMQTLKMPLIWMVALYLVGLGASSQSIISTWGGVFLADAYGLTKPVAAEILMVASWFGVAGCVVSGGINKRIGSAWVMLSSTILFLLVWLYMTVKIRSLSVLELKFLIGMVSFLQMYGIVAAFTVVRVSVPVSRVGFATGFSNCICWIGVGIYQQVWGLIIKNVSQGVSPYPIEAFQYSMWVQCISLVISFLCAVFMSKFLWKKAKEQTAAQ